jgi:hypothetical protein
LETSKLGSTVKKVSFFTNLIQWPLRHLVSRNKQNIRQRCNHERIWPGQKLRARSITSTTNVRTRCGEEHVIATESADAEGAVRFASVSTFVLRKSAIPKYFLFFLETVRGGGRFRRIE